VPPLRPASLHHLLAVRRAHALEKAVTGLSLAPVRLIRPLHLKLLWIGEARILCLIPYLVKRMSYFFTKARKRQRIRAEFLRVGWLALWDSLGCGSIPVSHHRRSTDPKLDRFTTGSVRRTGCTTHWGCRRGCRKENDPAPHCSSSANPQRGSVTPGKSTAMFGL